MQPPESLSPHTTLYLNIVPGLQVNDNVTIYSIQLIIWSFPNYCFFVVGWHQLYCSFFLSWLKQISFPTVPCDLIVHSRLTSKLWPVEMWALVMSTSLIFPLLIVMSRFLLIGPAIFSGSGCRGCGSSSCTGSSANEHRCTSTNACCSSALASSKKGASSYRTNGTLPSRSYRASNDTCTNERRYPI